MKRGLYFLVAMFMMVSSVEATNGSKLTNRYWVNNYSYDNAVNFFERGIEFFVFTNGDFDFDTSFNNRGVRIDRDFRGRIRRVGNVFINYDFRGNVTRIGNVFINYRRNRLFRVGNLEVRYDRWGYPIFYGDVRDNYYVDNGVRINLNIGRIFNFNDRFFFRNDFNRNYTRFREDRNFYYYRANKNARVGKNDKVIRRRKAASDRNNRIDNTRRNRTNRNSEFSYRKSNSNKKIDKIKKNTRRGSIIENKRRSPVKNNRGKKVDRKRRN